MHRIDHIQRFRAPRHALKLQRRSESINLGERLLNKVLNGFNRVNRLTLAELDAFAHDLHAYLTGNGAEY